MIVRLDADMLRNIMEEYDRDYFSSEGYDKLLELYPDDEELDPVSVCCTWTEYGVDAAVSLTDFICDYCYLFPDDEEPSIEELDYLEESEIEELVAKLQTLVTAHTYVFELSNGNILMKDF